MPAERCARPRAGGAGGQVNSSALTWGARGGGPGAVGAGTREAGPPRPTTARQASERSPVAQKAASDPQAWLYNL